MNKSVLFGAVFAIVFSSCSSNQSEDNSEMTDSTSAVEEKMESDFEYYSERFADIKILRYRVPSFEKLSAQQRVYVYYLTQAGLAGRDMIWDQNYRHNLEIRSTLEKIVRDFEGPREGEQWDAFMTYTKRVWFSNGIHHHYGMHKITPGFDEVYFDGLLQSTGAEISDEAMRAIFDPEFDAKKVNLDPNKGLVKGSAVNFYDPGITEAEVDAYYAALKQSADDKRISFGLNTKLVKTEDGTIKEEVYKADGMYGPAIQQVIYWLDKAAGVAETEEQAAALRKLIEYYQTGDLKAWDEYNVMWVEATQGDIDYIQGFVEVYNDPKGYKGSYESIVEIKDFDASERMKMLEQNVQWFEDNAPLLPEHKKENVVGVTYKVVQVAGEAGDASPSTPIGVNLPNANWIRVEHGSKSVSLGNIVEAYNEAAGGTMLNEFAHDQEEIDRITKYGNLAGKLHTALHEVVGHASGQIEPGVGTPKETLKSYSSTLEEARADLVALYYIYDQKMVDLGLMPNLEVGMAEYDQYILNGLMTQLRRIEPGQQIEESHMRNRQLVAAWVYEKGLADNVIEKVERDGKTYYNINDYNRLRVLFGDLLREIQRIKSQGDYQAGKDLVENYGVRVDGDIHSEVLARSESLNIAPYSGFINPLIAPVMEGDQIIDAKISYPDNFTEQMLMYSENFGFLSH
jgi:dipeptidyl-peptidase-3